MAIRRGDIYYIERGNWACVGSEQDSGRPAIIVSNDANNEHSSTVEVVYLTTREKKDMATHVEIRSAPRISTALCEQINTVAVERVGSFAGCCSDSEMMAIDAALAISIGLDFDQRYEPEEYEEEEEEVEEAVAPPENSINAELIRVEAERDTYKELYESLLKKVMRKSREEKRRAEKNV